MQYFSPYFVPKSYNPYDVGHGETGIRLSITHIAEFLTPVRLGVNF